MSFVIASITKNEEDEDKRRGQEIVISNYLLSFLCFTLGDMIKKDKIRIKMMKISTKKEFS